MANDSEQRDLETTVGILHQFHVQAERTCPVRGYTETVKQMLDAFHKKGYEDAELAYAAANRVPFGYRREPVHQPITHESGAYLQHHAVVLWRGNVYDPLYTRREPIPLDRYAEHVFSEDNVRLWKETSPDNYTTLAWEPKRNAA